MAEERNIFQKIGDAVTDYAPGIAGILALVPGVGTVPAAALGAVAALGRAAGLGSQAKPEEVLQAISVDPEIRLKAMVAENDFKVQMKDIELQAMKEETERIKANLADIQNARNMNVEGVKATGIRDYEDKVFDWMIVIGLFSIVFMMLYIQPPESTILGGLIGTISTAFIAVVQFRKGSTANSQTKTDMIYNSIPNFPKKEV
jgi:hypothetical protein